MSYDELLDQAYSKVKKVKNNERFEIPKIEGHTQGSKTTLTNFSEVCKSLRRKPEHISKFLIKELGVPGKLEGDRLVLNKKISISNVNEKIPLYVKEFVICKECGKPDTELEKKDRFVFVHCLACGAKHSVRAKL